GGDGEAGRGGRGGAVGAGVQPGPPWTACGIPAGSRWRARWRRPAQAAASRRPGRRRVTAGGRGRWVLSSRSLVKRPRTRRPCPARWARGKRSEGRGRRAPGAGSRSKIELLLGHDAGDEIVDPLEPERRAHAHAGLAEIERHLWHETGRVVQGLARDLETSAHGAAIRPARAGGPRERRAPHGIELPRRTPVGRGEQRA